MRNKDEFKLATIREKAIELIVEKGLDGFNMKDLAIASGISASTIYVYYKNKDDLLFQVCLWIRIKTLTFSVKGLRPGMNLEEGLHLQWKNRFKHFIDYPLEVQANAQLKYTPQYHRTTPLVTEAIGPQLKGFMENAVNNKELKIMPYELFWAIAFAPLYQLIEFHLAGSSYTSSSFTVTDKLITTAVKMIAKALRE